MTTTIASLPGSVTIEPGRGGLPRVAVATAAATAEVLLQGAHVTAWVPAGHDPVVWTSQRSAFAPGVPIRGGIPICFPWFGPGPTSEAGLHGFARTSEWTLTDAREQGDDVVLELRLTDADVPDAGAWPHPFEARLTITVGAALELRLTVANTGSESITFEEAFHTYLGVDDVRDCELAGLEDSAFVDRLADDEMLTPSRSALGITAETDRLYEQPGTIRLLGPARRIDVTAAGSGNAVVWNPWIAKAAAMADFGDDEWSRMVCVETCNVREHAVTLDPGASATMAATFRVSRDQEGI